MLKHQQPAFKNMHFQSPWMSLLKTLDTANKPMRCVTEAFWFYLTCMPVLYF